MLVPSLVEGFSLPLIEALACDTPVVAFDLEVYREVARGFATFLLPLNAKSWVDWLIPKSVEPHGPPSHLMDPVDYAKLCAYYSMDSLIGQHIAAY